MSFDVNALGMAVATHGPVARVVIAEVSGSAPRETGASMLVWADNQSGSIGGGALELEATRRARQSEADTVHRYPLGPALGQCCGGAVTIVTEHFTQERLGEVETGSPFARRVTGDAPMPLEIGRALRSARNQGLAPPVVFSQGWLLEPAARTRDPLWIHGAGHVGRALIDTISPLKAFDITWTDTAPDRFPNTVDPSITVIPATNLPALACHAPENAHHLVLTYSHEIDLALCHALLGHGFKSLGLIGSQTKWRRFQSRLAGLGHDPRDIGRIACPIGNPALGKSPHAISIGVAADLLSRETTAQANEAAS